MIDKGYTVQANFPNGIEGDNGGYTRTFYGGTTGDFKALQMHIHCPSEHTVNGYHFDCELHIVHLWADGSLGGVIGIFFDRKLGGTEENKLIQQMISPAPSAAPGTRRDIDLGDFMSTLDVSRFYAYPGGLTTPPCTEGVKWNVLMDAQPMSEAQYKFFEDMWHANPDFFGHGNYRRPQPLNGRIVQASVQPKGWPSMLKYSGAEMMTTIGATTLAALTLLNF